jgi:hypothetical protein
MLRRATCVALVAGLVALASTRPASAGVETITGIVRAAAADAPEAATVKVGEKKIAPTAKSGKVVGILTEKTDTEIVVKPEGKAEEQTFLLAAPGGAPSATVQAAAKTLFIPNLVALQWQLKDDQPVVTKWLATIRGRCVTPASRWQPNAAETAALQPWLFSAERPGIVASDLGLAQAQTRGSFRPFDCAQDVACRGISPS